MSIEAVPHDPQAAVEYMLKTAPRFAKAKAQRLYLEEFRKTKKALLMRESNGKAVADREAYAYSHPDYIELLDGLKEAIEAEETFRFRLKAAELHVEIWRSENANNRNQDRALR